MSIISPWLFYMADTLGALLFFLKALLFLSCAIGVCSFVATLDVTDKINSLYKGMKYLSEHNFKVKDHYDRDVTQDHIKARAQDVLDIQKEFKQIKRICKICLVVFIISSIGTIVIPNKETTYKMIAASVITTDNIKAAEDNIVDFIAKVANALENGKTLTESN